MDAGWIQRSTANYTYVYPQVIKPGLATLGGVQYIVVPHLPAYYYGANTKFLPIRVSTGAEVVTDVSTGKTLSPSGRGLAEVFDAGTGTHLQVFTGCTPYVGQAKLNFEKFSLVPGTSAAWIESKSLNIGPGSVTDMQVTNFVIDGGVLKGIATWPTTSPTDRVYRLFSWDFSSASLTTIKDWYQTADGLTVNGTFGWLCLAGGDLYLMNYGSPSGLKAHKVSDTEFTALADVIPLPAPVNPCRVDFAEDTNSGMVHIDIQPTNSKPYGSSRWIPGDDGWAVKSTTPIYYQERQFSFSGDPVLAIFYPYSDGTYVQEYYFSPTPSVSNLRAAATAGSNGGYSLSWSYSDPNALGQAEIKLEMQDMINTTFVVSNAPDTSYNGEYKYAKRNWGRAVYTNGLRWLYSVREGVVGYGDYGFEEVAYWYLGTSPGGSGGFAYLGGGYLPTDNAGGWRNNSGTLIAALAVATGTSVSTDTGWISHTSASYTGTAYESEYEISLQVKNAPPLSQTVGPVNSVSQFNRLITKRGLSWTRPILVQSDIESQHWGAGGVWNPGRWLSIPTPTDASTDFHVLDAEREIFGNGTLRAFSGHYVINTTSPTYGMTTQVKSLKASDYSSQTPSYELMGALSDDTHVTAGVIETLNTGSAMTYRLDEAPHPPVCVLKMMTYNPYFFYSDQFSGTDQLVILVSGCGDSTYNGTYIQSGTTSEAGTTSPKYTNGSRWLYSRFGYDWHLNPTVDLSVGPSGGAYYKNPFNTDPTIGTWYGSNPPTSVTWSHIVTGGQDFTCLGGDNNYIQDLYHLYRMHGVDSPMPLRDESMSSRGLTVSIPVTFTALQGVSSTAPGGFSDTPTIIPAKVWVGLTFSTDGRGGNATTKLLGGEINGNQTVILTVDAADISGDYLDEVALYWRNRYMYYSRTPFPTSMETMIGSPYYVVKIGQTGISSFKLALTPV